MSRRTLDPCRQQRLSRRPRQRAPCCRALDSGVPAAWSPPLTCLDLIVAQPVFTAADITVDSIIRVSSCGARFTHRVVAIRNVRERRYYQTKGDAHPEPDNCWIPHHDVYGLIVDIERNAVPQNAALRDGVNAAKALILANPEDAATIVAYDCWRRAALTSRYPGDIPHEC